MQNVLALFGTEVLLVIVILLLAGLLAVLVLHLKLVKRVNAIPHMKISEEIMSKLQQHHNHIGGHTNQISSIMEMVHMLESKQTLMVKTYVHRYNPFRDSGVGGNQSFSVAIADEHGTGLLITSLYSREMNRVSSKPLANWTNTEYTISPEEQFAIDQLRK